MQNGHFTLKMGISRKWSGKVLINRWLQKHLREGDGKAHFSDEMMDFHEFPDSLHKISFSGNYEEYHGIYDSFVTLSQMLL